MGILGLTHDDSGAALEKLPVMIKVAIGEGPEPSKANSHPRRLDHFVFKRKTLRAQDVVWLPAPDISEAHGEKPTALGIIFLNDDPREVFRTEYAWWTPTGCKCHGELVQIANGSGVRFEMQALRRTEKHPEGEPWPGNYEYATGPKKGQTAEPCGDGCPDLERGDCRPSGDLYFILEKFPTFGAICRLHTSSYRSIRNLSNGLMQIRRLSGGRLTGIRATLKASPEKVWYSDPDGTRHTSVAYILSLEIGATDLRTLVASMTEPARLLSEGRLPIELSRGYVARETEAERAKEISAEFYPDHDAAADAHAEPTPDQSERHEQLARICELARRLGYKDTKLKMLIGQSADNLAELERELLNESDERPAATLAGKGENRQKQQQAQKTGQTIGAMPTSGPASAAAEGKVSADDGFLF